MDYASPARCRCKIWSAQWDIDQATIANKVMDTFLKIFIVVLLALACIGWLADQRAAAKRSNVTPGLSLLPGDIKYESPNGQLPPCIVGNGCPRRHHRPDRGPQGIAPDHRGPEEKIRGVNCSGSVGLSLFWVISDKRTGAMM